MPHRRAMSWDGDADQHLLLAILATHSVKLDYVSVAKRLGPHCTGRAVEERLKKLKRMARDSGFDPSATEAGQDSSPVSSVKRAAVPRRTKSGAAGAKLTSKLAPLGSKTREGRKARKDARKAWTGPPAQTDDERSSSVEVSPTKFFQKDENAKAKTSTSPGYTVDARGTKRSYRDFKGNSEESETGGDSSEEYDEPTSDVDMADE
ncbi:MAG: hypothetical protein M1815_005215 [Lichina confinis]|nr:MAG: hypothetical protein M1815_005215 [Lichina confinis]